MNTSGKAFLEPENIVHRKSQACIKLLADHIVSLSLKKLEKESVNFKASEATLNDQGTFVLKQLAESIAHKYHFNIARPQERPSSSKQDLHIGHDRSPSPINVPNASKIFKSSHVTEERRAPVLISHNVTETIKGERRSHYAGDNSSRLAMVTEEGVIKQNVVDKTFDVIVEVPVVREILVERPYDVIVEKPVENRIEKEICLLYTSPSPRDS